MRIQERRDNAGKRLPVFLRVRKLQDGSKTIGRRLLCLLQLRDYPLSANSTRKEMLLAGKQ
jgi:hypothetical protein